MTMKDFIERYGLPLGDPARVRPGPGAAAGQRRRRSTRPATTPSAAMARSTGSEELAEGGDPAAVDTSGGATDAGSGGRGRPAAVAPPAARTGAQAGRRRAAARWPSGRARTATARAGRSACRPTCLRACSGPAPTTAARRPAGSPPTRSRSSSWLGQEDPATRQALSAAELQDPPAVVERAFNALNKFHNAYYQTYGREVKLVQMNASGESTNDAAMKADAVKIADEHKAFAVFAGNALAPIPTVLARELAQRGVLCICTTSLSSAFYNELPPTIFSGLPTIDEYAAHAAEYAAKKLAGKKASLGGAGTTQQGPGVLPDAHQRRAEHRRPGGRARRPGLPRRVQPGGHPLQDDGDLPVRPGEQPERHHHDGRQAQVRGLHDDRPAGRPDPADPDHQGSDQAGLLPGVVHRRHRAVRHLVDRALLRPGPVAARLRHVAALGHLGQGRELLWLPRVPRRHARRGARATRACSSTSTGVASSWCSRASTWPART